MCRPMFFRPLTTDAKNTLMHADDSVSKSGRVVLAKNLMLKFLKSILVDKSRMTYFDNISSPW